MGQMENLSTAHLKSFRGKQLRIQYWGSKQPESFPCEAEEYVPVPVHELVLASIIQSLAKPPSPRHVCGINLASQK
jgi:hypothetical protein